MQESSKLRVGVVGVGYLGEHHARIYGELDCCDLVGVYDSNPERAKEIGDKYGCPVFEDLEAVKGACDAVSLVVPTDKHHEVALPLLEAGLHLLIEKPLCTSLKEAQEIAKVAREHGCLVQVGHIEHYNPVMSYLEEAVVDPQYITADRLAPFNIRGTEVGVVLDLMIHDIGVILQLVKSPIERIDAVGVNVISATEDIANARIAFKNGAVANINTSRVSQKKVREIRIFQPMAYLSLDFMKQEGSSIRLKGLEMKQEVIPITKSEPLRVELEAFVNCIVESEQPKVDSQVGISALDAAIRVTEQIQANLEKRRSERESIQSA